MPTNYAQMEFIDEPDTLTTYSYTNNGLCFEYFIGREVATLIGYKNTQDVVNNFVSSSNKFPFRKYPGKKEPYLDPRTILISRKGVEEILLSTNKIIIPPVKRVLEDFKFNLHQSLEEPKKVDIKIVNKYVQPEIIEESEELTEYSYISNGLCFEYFVGYEVATLLDYKNPHHTVKNSVSKCNQLPFREYPGIKHPPLDPRTILISRDGVAEILQSTRKLITPTMQHILDKFQFNLTNCKKLSPEQQNLSFITNSFKIEDAIPQYPVGTYRLDLYFPKYKIIIECDENGHADRHPEKEKEREDYVNKELGVTSDNWVRFNPDDPYFDIANVIGQIHLRMVNSQNQEVKRCCTCRKEKKFVEFYLNKNSPGGINARCKDCVKNYTAKAQLAKEQVGIVIPDEKHCLQCDIIKPKEQFWKNKCRKDGLNNLCTECAKEEKLKHKFNTNKSLPEFKVCSCCGESKKTVESFGQRSASIDGYTGKCKDCSNKWLVEYRREKKSMSRKCKKCGISKTPDNFKKVTRGLSTICNKCTGEVPDTKSCSSCGNVKSFTEYYKRRQSADGMNGRCIECVKRS